MSEATIQVIEQASEEIPATGARLHIVIAGARFFTVTAALREAAEVKRMVDALKREGLHDSDIMLAGISLDVSKGMLAKSSSATYQLRANCTELQRLPKLLDALADQRNCQLTHTEWLYEQSGAIKTRLLQLCADRSRRKASAMAEALGVEIIGLHQIREEAPPMQGGFEPPGQALGLRARGSISSELSGLTLAPSQEVSVRVEASFSVRPLRARAQDSMAPSIE